MHNLDKVMEEFRQGHDCRDMDAIGINPVLIFNVSEKRNGQWNKISGEFYADTLLEAVDQAREWDGPFDGMLKAEVVGACEFFMEGDMPHVILDIESLQHLYNGLYFESLIPPKEEFREKVLSRRSEMKEAGLLS